MTTSGLSPIRWWHSIRLRIAAGVTAVTLATLVPAGVFIDYWAALQARERLRVNTMSQLNTATVTFLASRIATVGVTENIQTAPAQLRDVRYTPGMSASFFDGQAMWAVQALPPSESFLNDDPFNETNADLVYLVIASPADSLHAERRSLRLAMQWVAIPGVVLAAGLGWLVASGLSRRLRQTAGAARQLDVYQPTALPVGQVHDEVNALAQAVNDMTTRLAQRADAEREFSALVAHELRTPTTALVSASELLGDDETGQVMRRGVHRLQRLIEDLLELFRAEGGVTAPSLAELDLATITAQVLTQHPKATAVSFTETTRSSIVLVDPRRFERALTNLVTNAVLHGGGSCTVEVLDNTVSVSDDGPGFPQWLLHDGPEPFRRESKSSGSGLGLAIAQRQVQLSHGTIVFRNRPGGGAHVQVTFTAAAA